MSESDVRKHVGDWADMREKVLEFLNDSVRDERDILILSMSEDTCGFISTIPNDLMMEFLLLAIDRLARMGIIKPEDLTTAVETLKRDVTYN